MGLYLGFVDGIYYSRQREREERRRLHCADRVRVFRRGLYYVKKLLSGKAAKRRADAKPCAASLFNDRLMRKLCLYD